MRPSDTLTVFLAVGVSWLLAGAACEIAFAAGGPDDLRWLGLHLAFVGGVSQMVIGAGQFFACAFLATEPPGRRVAQAELVVWNVATVCIAVGVPADVVPLTGMGGTLLLVGLVLFDRELRAMRRRSIQRVPWATRWYRTAALFLAGGALLGPVMAGDTVWTHGSLLGTHLVLNLGGWFGTAIVGTLHTFYPSLTDTRLRFARLQAPTYLLWCGGVALLALACAFTLDALSLAGWALLLMAAALLTGNLLASAVAGRVRTTPAALVSAGQVLLVVALAEGLARGIEDGPVAAIIGLGRERLVVPLLAGWIGLTVIGSLLHLLTLMARIRGRPDLGRGPSRDLWALVGAVAVLAGVGALLVGDGPHETGRLMLALGYGVLLARVSWLARRAVGAAPLRVWRGA